MNTRNKENLVSQAECARRLGCAKSLITRWVKDGRLQKHGKHVALSEALAIQEKSSQSEKGVNESDPKGNGYDLWMEKARTEHYTAELRKLEFEKKSGQLVEISLVGEHLDRSFISIKQRFLAVPQKLAPVISAAKTTEEVRLLIQAEVTEILNELSTYNAESGESERPGRIVPGDKPKPSKAKASAKKKRLRVGNGK